MKTENISIHITLCSEAEELWKIQKAAFKPLYEKYHDEGNPYLRDINDIKKRIDSENFCYYTILSGEEIVGGIVYRTKGKRSPTEKLKKGEYYLNRVYISPEYQGRGIASKAILLCENEFPDVKTYYVDFPADLDKNRRCYTKAGYYDTGKQITEEGNPPLAMFKKSLKKDILSFIKFSKEG